MAAGWLWLFGPVTPPAVAAAGDPNDKPSVESSALAKLGTVTPMLTVEPPWAAPVPVAGLALAAAVLPDPPW
jgi:hypothetical protein